MSLCVMFSGVRVDPAYPDPRKITMRDIAAHLSKLCLYNGATRVFYSEAQHAVIVATQMAQVEGPLAALYGLLHDACKAIPTDSEVNRANVARAVLEAMDLDWPTPPAITRALLHVHARVALAEMRQLLTGWDDAAKRMSDAGVVPAPLVIKPVSWDRAHDQFLDALRSHAVAAQVRHLPAMEGI
jgi:hypothetical protein